MGRISELREDRDQVPPIWCSQRLPAPGSQWDTQKRLRLPPPSTLCELSVRSFCYALDCLEERIIPTKGFLLDYSTHGCVLASSLQSCPTLCDPMDCSPPGSSVHGLLQARILEWVAMPCSRGSSWPRDRTQVSYASRVGRWPWWLRWWRIYLQCGRPGFNPWFGKIPWRREQLPTPVFWPGEFHGQRRLAVYSPWGSQRVGHEWATFTLSLSLPLTPPGKPIQHTHSHVNITEHG